MGLSNEFIARSTSEVTFRLLGPSVQLRSNVLQFRGALWGHFGIILRSTGPIGDWGTNATSRDLSPLLGTLGGHCSFRIYWEHWSDLFFLCLWVVRSALHSGRILCNLYMPSQSKRIVPCTFYLFEQSFHFHRYRLGSIWAAALFGH